MFEAHAGDELVARAVERLMTLGGVVGAGEGSWQEEADATACGGGAGGVNAIQALIMRLLRKQVIEDYGDLLREATKLCEVNKSLMEALEFYASPEAYEGNPIPVMEDGGMAARVVIQVAKELHGDSTVSP